MRIGTCVSHFIGSYLRRLHELIIGSQGSDAVFLTERVGAVNDVLFHGIHIGGGSCNLRLRYRLVWFRLSRCFAGVGLSTFHLHTAVVAVPINIEADRFANVAEFHIVVSSNTIRFHLHLLPIDKNTMVAAFSEDSRSIGGSSACDNSADKKARKHREDLLLHGKASLFLIYYSFTIIKRLFQQKIFKMPEQPAHTSADWNLRQRR